MSTSTDRIGGVAAWIRQASRVVALTGAGISTDSGIPDFRGPQGVWTKNPEAEKLSSLQHYMNDPELRRRAWQLRLDHPGWRAKPNPGHLALAELEARGCLHALITQNIDGLHLAAGSSPDVVIEIHGTLRDVVCMSCGERAPMSRALERVRSGESDPPCRSCGGILKSATISFGQALEEADLLRARDEASACDVFLAVGTSLTVYPVAHLPRIALRSAARLVIVNDQPTPLDEHADIVLHGNASMLLSELLIRIRDAAR